MSPLRLRFVFLVLVLTSTPTFIAAQPATGKLPSDRAVLELDVPNGTQISLAGKDYGTKTKFSYKDMPEGRWYRFEVGATFPGGERAEVPLLLEGGWHIRLPLRPKAQDRVELVTQTGHARSVNSVALSSDGRHILTGSGDRTAILWDVRSAKTIRRFVGHKGVVWSVAFNDDGQRALTGSEDKTTVLWNVQSGEKLQTFKGHSSDVLSVALSGDSTRVLTGSGDGTAILWDATRGQKLQTFAGHSGRGAIKSVALSSDGRCALTGADYGDSLLRQGHCKTEAILWDVQTGQQLQTFVGHISTIRSVALSTNGRRALTASEDRTAILWDVQSGKKVRTFAGGERDQIYSVALSGDGRRVLTAAYASAAVWDAGTGEQLQTFKSDTSSSGIWAAVLSRDGRHVLTGTTDGSAALWDATNGKKVQNFTGRAGSVADVALSGDGRHVLAAAHEDASIQWDAQSGQQVRIYPVDSRFTFHRGFLAMSGDGRRILGRSDSAAVLWDAQNGQRLHKFGEDSAIREGVGPNHLAVNGDGSRAVIAYSNNAAYLWDGESGRKLHVFQTHGSVYCLALSADGRRAVTASPRSFTNDEGLFRSVSSVELWDTESGRKLQTFDGHAQGDIISSVALSRNGDHALTGSSDKTAVLWQTRTGRQLQTFRGHTARLTSVALSSSAHRVLTGAEDGTVILWDSATGEKLHTLSRHAAKITAVALKDDGRQALTGAEDGTLRFWDLATGQELCQLVSLDKGKDWLVTTPEGLFDGSAGGRQEVSYRVGRGLNVVPVDRFFQDFYYPGLLAALWRGERPMPGVKFAAQQPPVVRILSPKTGGAIEESRVAIEVEAEDRGGGIKGPWLLHNGARVLAPGQPRREGQKLQRSYMVALVEGENRLEVKAASADGSWESEPVRLVLQYAKPLAKAQLHLVVVGINRYATGAMNLRFAAPDAQAVADLFTRRGQSLYRQVHAHTLLDDQATRKNLRDKLKQVAQQAQPQDTVLLFLAGHGTMVGQRYYFISHDFKRGAGSLEDDIRNQALPGDEIGEYLAVVPALKRVLVFDTCQSGGALGLAKTARNPFAFRGAIERLSRAQGVFTIAASAASEEAQEVAELKHGVLTYALLAALKGVRHGPLSQRAVQTESPERVASVLEWFNFASGQVPRLTQRYFGREQDVQTSSQGQSFPLLPLEEP